MLALMDEKLAKQAELLSMVFQKTLKENNQDLAGNLKEQFSESINSLTNHVDTTLAKQDKKNEERLKIHMEEVDKKMKEMKTELTSLKMTHAPIDAWANFKPSNQDAGASSSGSAAQRRESAKRRFIESADPADDPRNQRNTLRVHIKGFVKAVPPAVHRKCWDSIVSQVGEHLVGAKPKTGNFDYNFVVDCQSEAQALQAIELINGLNMEWPDIKDPTSKGNIRAHSDRSPNAKKSNKIYGEIRKMLEEFLGKEMDTAPLVRTSGPRGPIYVEFPDGDAMEVLKIHKNFSSGEETLRVNPECLEPLKLNDELVKDFYKKALAMASRWE